jgi:arginase
MARGAFLDLAYPETGVVEKDTLDEQTEALASVLPERPLVVGGCCCAHVGAARGLAAKHARLAVVWLDAHGDLNTPGTSPSGNLWGMPFRMILDQGIVALEDAALVGARNLDPPEVEFMTAAGLDASLQRALDGADAAYVALDLDVLDPAEADVLMPEPDGLTEAEVAAVLEEVRARVPLAGIGVTGFVATERNAALTARLLASAGL